MSQDSAFETAFAVAGNLIRYVRDQNGEAITRDVIEREVSGVLGMRPEWTELDRARLIAELETVFRFWIGDATTLQDNRDHVRWLDRRAQEINWRFWSRYRSFLQERGWADATIDKLDSMCTDILGLLEDPQRENAWDRRGMVVGRIQSGKTANYIGLINKAVDAGYKLIVVLAGVHNSLRSQTQIRLDEGFLGYDSIDQLGTHGRHTVGVGRIAQFIPSPDTITTRADNGDFKTDVAQNFHISPGLNPLLFVVKKNGSVLRNLLNWVEWSAHGGDAGQRAIVRGIPLLLIDDEADYGSIDTSELRFESNGQPDLDHDPTVINQRIRRLLYAFEKSAYVGYTATPFANIFIHERAATREEGDDLFPRSFIMNLPAPSNYTGPRELFGLGSVGQEEFQPLPVIREIADAWTDDVDEIDGWMPPRHSAGHVPTIDGRPELPPSLRRALLSFILSCAARNARGQMHRHKSMLIHVTRFVDVQRRVYDQVVETLQTYRTRFQRETTESVGTLREELEDMWIRDFVPTIEAIEDAYCAPITWQEVVQHVMEVLLAVEVRQINGTSRDVLDYTLPDARTIIAIGGDKLSRGLTLEGLSVSYFLRASRMYDTLMQMGRWFGYRHGYIDICRLFTTEELANWFQHIAEAEEELREEFDHMAAVGATPLEYGLRVRSHPSLLVTSRVKMRHGTELEYTCHGRLIQTLRYHRIGPENALNYSAMQELLNGARQDGAIQVVSPVRQWPDGRREEWRNSIRLSNVSPMRVIEFLRSYRSHPEDFHIRTTLLTQYITNEISAEKLASWDVLIRSGDGTTEHVCAPARLHTVKRDWRSGLSDEQKADLGYFWTRSTLTPRDERIDLTDDEYRRAGILTGEEVRMQRSTSRGLLIIYPLDPTIIAPESENPVVGFALSFPNDTESQPLRYVVNNVFEQTQEL
ncbi:MAG TPA: Z1 domain-containing protein [bacterium]|jgi:hypothetical protein